jgi:hypothetical protein
MEIKKRKRTFHVDIEYPSTTLLQLNIPLQLPSIRIILVILLLPFHCLGNMRRPDQLVPSLWLCDMYAVDDRVDLAAFKLGVDAVREKCITCFVFKVHHTFLGKAGYLHTLDVFGVNDLLDECAVVRCEILQSGDVYFVDDEQCGFASE